MGGISMANNMKLLTDEQMRQFITDGFLILQTDFSAEFHQHLLQQLNTIYETEGNPGNNLLPRMPELQKVFDHPIVRGGLTSVLGPNYLLHAHRHGHFNNSPKPGGWHKDSYWGYGRTRNLHPWWAMIMYFPQDTPVELGPTGVMPGSHYYETRTFAEDDNKAEAKASGGAGTFALIHFDIWHRSTANIAGIERYMLKFEFVRTQAPISPSWDNQEREWVAPTIMNPAVHSHQVLWEETWGWLSGRVAGQNVGAGNIADAENAANDVSAENTANASQADAEAAMLLKQLQDEDKALRVEVSDRLAMLCTPGLTAAEEIVKTFSHILVEDAYEPVALNAAYGLARMGGPGIAALAEALAHESKLVSRTAVYGLTAAGPAAVQPLLAALRNEREDTISLAVFALGELGKSASEVVPALAKLLDHPSAKVRNNIVEALGNLGATGNPDGQIAAALSSSLQDADPQVRFMASLSLTKLGAAGEPAIPQLIQALEDDNRYVRAHAADALYYIGTAPAKDALLRFLRTSRWCPTTTSASTFYP
jgi:HEAT repeat protein